MQILKITVFDWCKIFKCDWLLTVSPARTSDERERHFPLHPYSTYNFNTAMPLTIPACSASASELAVYLVVRADTFYKKTFFTCQCVATLCVVLVPLFVTSTASYGAARKACHDRAFMLKNVTNFDVDSPNYDPEWGMDDDAQWRLFPVHVFNSISTVMSLFGFWVWLFFSPHMADVARDLDRTCTKLKCIFQVTQTCYS
jgi:hypothetical protein